MRALPAPGLPALCLPAPRPVAPFGDLPADLPVLNRPLREVQHSALRRAGFTPVDAPPASGLYLCYRADCWFTAAFLRRLAAAARPGRPRISDAAFLRQSGAQQSDPARPPLALRLAPEPPGLDGPDLDLDLGLTDAPPIPLHPAMQHAALGPLRTGAALAHPVEHWTHLLRVNLLALLARGEEHKEDFAASPWWKKLGFIVSVLWKARGVDGARLARAVSRIGKNCRIHPTATVEACEIGDDVEIGPYACLRACVIGDGAKLDAYSHANLAVLGPKARLGDGAMLNLSVLLEEAFVSRGDGFQMSVFGKTSFLAVGVTMLDLSFGRTIPVEQDGRRVDSACWFLGGCIGHRSRIGNGVRIGYGMAVPNDVLLVAGGDDLLRRWGEGEGTFRVVEGVGVGG